MPHKHKRKRGDDTELVLLGHVTYTYCKLIGASNSYDLPPSHKAQSLPVLPKSKNAKNSTNASANSKRSTRKQGNDTPRAFRRLMAFSKGKKPRSGLDNDGEIEETKRETPKIRPGEDIRSFSTRVNAEIPVAGLAKKAVVKDGKDEQGLKVYRTRKEYKMHKLYDQWRAEEEKIQEDREEDAERDAERELNAEEGSISSKGFASLGDNPWAKRRTKKGRRIKDDEDPWSQLKKKRAEPKIGLHDTALAPPTLSKHVRKQPLLVEGAAVNVSNVPKAAGSLRRREELQELRDDVLDAYRKIRDHEQAKLRAS